MNNSNSKSVFDFPVIALIGAVCLGLMLLPLAA